MSIVSNVFRDKLASCPGFIGFSRVSSSARPVNSNGAAFEECSYDDRLGASHRVASAKSQILSPTT